MNRPWRPGAAIRSGVDGAAPSASWADRGPGPWAIALLGVLAFSGVVALGSMLVSQFAGTAASAEVGRQAASVATAVTDALERVQRERGLAQLVMAEGDGLFLEEYRQSIADTDAALDRLERSLAALGATQTNLTGRLQQAREQAGLRGDQTFDLYSDIVETLLSQLTEVTVSAPDPEGAASRSAVVRLVRAVEALGQRRGMVGAAIRSGQLDQDLRQTSRLQASEAQREIIAAASLVTDDLEPIVRALATSPRRDAANAMLDELSGGQRTSDGDVLAWRSTTTAQMEEVSQVVQVVEEAEMARLQQIERVARRNLVASVALLGLASVVSLVAAWAGFDASREHIRALREHEILVDGLRDWFVNEPLPAIEGVTIESLYRAADEYTRAGGDWVEVYPLPNGQVVFGVGDVVGHGPQAVAGMVLIKSMMRGQAVEGRRSLPAGIERLDRAVTDRNLVATLFYAVWTPEEGSLTWLSAGHVPAILKQPDGSTVLLEGGPSDALIGFDTGLPRTATDTPIAHGSTLIIYTDGLIEAPGVDPAESIARLSEIERPNPGAPDGERLVDLLAAQRRDQRDDVAILVVGW
ncbi:MAG: SpoIIE family protein phosphatase [Acidimicrobiia bacterium]